MINDLFPNGVIIQMIFVNPRRKEAYVKTTKVKDPPSSILTDPNILNDLLYYVERIACRH